MILHWTKFYPVLIKPFFSIKKCGLYYLQTSNSP